MRLQIGIEGRTWEVEVEVLQADGVARPPGYTPYPAMPPTLQSTPSHPSTNGNVDGGNVDPSKACRSPVAGIVIRINVEPGRRIEANDLLLVLEAMKMETNVTAPAAGTVKAVMVKPQDSVKVGRLLVEFE